MNAELERQLECVADGTPYAPEAYLFLMRSLEWSMLTSTEQQHIDGVDLCWNMHRLAIRDYGTRAQETLESWGVCSTDDFGKIMYRLIDKGLSSKSDSDRIEDFHAVYDFDDAFTAKNREAPIQWSILSLFLIITLGAVFLGGARTLGLIGGLWALYSSWIAFIGGFCLYAGIRTPTGGRFVALVVGTLLLAVGVASFFLAITW